MAAQSGDSEILLVLLEAGADINTSGGEHGSALISAINEEELECVKVLLKNNADPNLVGAEQQYPVHFATRKGLLDILKLLVDYGANLHVTCKNKLPLLLYATVWNSAGVVNYLLKREGIDINGRGPLAQTPLAMTTRLQRNFVRNILKRSPDVDCPDFKGTAPLMTVTQYGSVRLMTLLLEHKADLSKKDVHGRTTLYFACRSPNVEAFECISKALNGCDFATEHREMAVHATILANRPKLLSKILEDVSIRPNQADDHGWTPLYTASMYDRQELVFQLRIAGASEPRARDALREKPSRWHPREKLPCFEYKPDGREVVMTEALKGPDLEGIEETYSTIKADHPMIPIGKEGVYYFEIRIEVGSENGLFSIGFCEQDVGTAISLGKHCSTWGYYGTNGKVSTGHESDTDYGEPCNTGDVIGCGVNFVYHTAFYTKNGKVIRRAFSNVRGKLFPAVTMDATSPGCQISAKFWSDRENDFCYKGELDAPATLEPPVNPTVTHSGPE
ncbi:ankyrin repeat-containing domain protein [Massariosphaeria phaeospora]|uniref:Ankyrin repeat-containing domain protein n=1 Tax=Massariosphaeria phaeospora TaxID=100035 RepID=A0A7C8MIQ8_9PLEO|nr:ankyrin repeat-containing domain protein [Massariosphaeria phaeospora]